MGGDSSGFGRVRMAGIVAGVVGAALAVSAPLLPVRQERASLDWPQPQSMQLSAPLVDYVPLSLDLSVPCTALRDLTGATVLSTVPPQAPRAGSKGLVARIEDRPETGRTLAVVLRDRLLLSASLAEIAGPGGSPAGTGPEVTPDPGSRTDPGATAPAGPPPGGTAPGSPPPGGAVPSAPPPSSSALPSGTAPSGGVVQPSAAPAGLPGDAARTPLGSAPAAPPSGTTGSLAPTSSAGPGTDPRPALGGGAPSNTRQPAGAPQGGGIPGSAGENVQAAACGALTITSTASRTTAELTGLRKADGSPLRTVIEGDMRPQIVGVYTELDRGRMGDARLHAEIDTRFSSSPSGWKLAAILGAVLCTLIALICLHRADIRDGRNTRRVLPARWWRPTRLDGVVAGTLVVWHVVGANSSDDGYILTMAKASREAGYTANYYRWFQVAEAPFGWPYEVLAQLTRVSEAGLWMRLPALLAGLVCWLLLSREVLPRLGSRVTGSVTARWTAALVFLALWLPFNNGLRPEPLIAVGALLTWCSMERAIATRRLLPAAVAVLVAAFSLAAGPTGLICLGALLAGSRPVLRVIAARAAADSGPALSRYAAVLAPIVAAGTLVLVVVFADQTFSTVLEATRVRQLVGPDMSWFEERTRWDSLLSVNPDGSLARRFGVLAMLLCLAVGILAAVRRGGRIPGTARGPVTRVLAVTFLALLLMMFTPTKWTHHFGVYAGLAGALAAITTIALSRTVLRANYLRTLFAAAVGFLLAVCFTGSNGYWYVSGYGVPWPDRAPALAGIEVSTLFLAATALTLLVALWQYYRTPENSTATRSSRFPAVAPLTLAAAAMVLLDVGSLATAAVSQYPAYSVALSNLRTMTGDQCAMADEVLVETNTADSLLTPYTGPVADGLAAANTGFTPNGLGSLAPDPGPGQSSAPPSGSGPTPGPGGQGGAPTGPPPSGGGAPGGQGGTPGGSAPSGGPGSTPSGSAPTGGTAGQGAPSGPGAPPSGGSAPGAPGGGSAAGAPGGGSGPVGVGQNPVTGVNGSTVALPFGLVPERTPVLGSYSTGAPRRSALTTQWYRLDLAAAQQNPAHRVLILTVAGRIDSVAPDGSRMPGQRLRVEFARRAEDGTVTPTGELTPPTVGGAPGWRNLPIDLDRIPVGTTAVRLVAESGEPDPMQWLALTPPRLPTLSPLNTVVGTTDPVLTDFHVGLAFPCQRPFDHRLGVAEVPLWRIQPDKLNAQVSETWQGDTGGGPLGWTGLLTQSRTIPAYLAEDWTRDWGELQRLTRLIAAPPAELTTGRDSVWGWTGESPVRTR
ncbi:arabinosyltransferase domain-containing protein [Nocardia asteroides]|uniref:arabinosyltransferase domain-containing protein n=1 Tax=Nocardia asteroides TaxID=1824 RepID=UPI0037C7746A